MSPVLHYLSYKSDLKPENLLLVNKDTDSKIKVIDFGTSRKFDTNKRMTKRLGTVILADLCVALLHCS